MFNYKMDISYDGTEYSGWQRQNNSRTIQSEIENALARILQEKIILTGAGRTDSGVHAFKQVANFKTTKKIDCNKFKVTLNKIICKDISITDLKNVDKNFSSRFNASAREYEYRISTNKNPFNKKYLWQVNYNLELNLMRKALTIIKSQNKFKVLSKNVNDSHDFKVKIYSSSIRKTKSEFILNIKANRFLRGMVRAIVGILVDVGRKKRELNDIHNLFNGIKVPVMFAPARGLFLKNVYYSKLKHKIDKTDE